MFKVLEHCAAAFLEAICLSVGLQAGAIRIWDWGLGCRVWASDLGGSVTYSEFLYDISIPEV